MQGNVRNVQSNITCTYSQTCASKEVSEIPHMYLLTVTCHKINEFTCSVCNNTHAPNLSSEPGTDEERKSSPEVTELSAVQYFSLVFKTAQRDASVSEGPKKCMHNERSERTTHRHKRAKVLMEAKGFLSLPEVFEQKAKRLAQQETNAETASGPDDVLEMSTEPPTTADEAKAVSTASTESKLASAAVPMVAVTALDASPVFTTVLEEEEEDEDEDEENPRISRPSWRASQLVFYESEESDSQCSGDATSSPEELKGSDTLKLKSLHQENSPNDDASKHFRQSRWCCPAWPDKRTLMPFFKVVSSLWSTC